MLKYIRIGVDIAKNSFQVHALESEDCSALSRGCPFCGADSAAVSWIRRHEETADRRRGGVGRGFEGRQGGLTFCCTPSRNCVLIRDAAGWATLGLKSQHGADWGPRLHRGGSGKSSPEPRWCTLAVSLLRLSEPFEYAIRPKDSRPGRVNDDTLLATELCPWLPRATLTPISLGIRPDYFALEAQSVKAPRGTFPPTISIWRMPISCGKSFGRLEQQRRQCILKRDIVW
jgi:hypothetical protein